MPGTAHGVADHEPVGERTVVMRAMGADREDLRAAAHQQNLLVADMADELAAVGKLGDVQRPASDRATRLGLVSHLDHPLMAPLSSAICDAGSRPSPAPSSLPYASAGNV